MNAGIVKSAKAAWITLLLSLAVIIGLFALPAQENEASTVGGLSDKYQTTQVNELLEEFPDAQESTALIVVSRTDGAPMTDADQAAIAEINAAAAELGAVGPPPQVPPIVSENKLVGLVPVTLKAAADDGDAVAAEVEALRGEISATAPEGLKAELTGGAAFTADLAGVFSGANFILLTVTAGVVALLLLVTYRSPWLWLVPLAVVATIEQAALKVVDLLAPVVGIDVDPSAVGITSVLVFGAATNYALLLIARYREELRIHESKYEAMGKALSRTREAIIASGGTVILALLVLLFTDTMSYRGLGFSAATGIVLAILSALFILPAALVLLGRKLFWPFVPKVGDAAREGKFWGKLGEVTARAPKRIAGAAVVVLLAAGGLLFNVQIGLSENEQFTEKPQAVTAAETLAEGFPAGSSSPVIVLVNSDSADAAVEELAALESVSGAEVASEHNGMTRIDVIDSYEPGTDGANAFIGDLRSDLAANPEYEALVGGEAAERVDQLAANQHDLTLVVTSVIILVFLVLLVLLRSIVAPVLLVASVLLTFVASTGISWFLFVNVLGFPALDTLTLLYSFIFLVALGVDYNIFLTTRARENAVTMGTKAGMLSALRSTGGVITSAGILLAAVFAVLGVLPLVTLTQVGITVAIGVLLDTLVVRTVIVPALAFILGEKFWWPSKPAQHGGTGGRHEAPAGDSGPRRELAPAGAHRAPGR
ncbi:MMPL family transporter [Arthrobacter jiangjiafuii]|uniref:MMPL family transporter n=1 Tax=Arthrobacter jiangjiafuii TaxID=2817475 RepID=A0A975M601_9MICC|nr:MMPL family transporter [Arthrobacter jiangjiafuii]MBP3045066.1 MMPL family transporter [Arthrobacter jiangjiafuii]QWC10613.1 MMPL family transporter [Arthrobacter jiangjiafuii]